jgi:hypothetical protein
MAIISAVRFMIPPFRPHSSLDAVVEAYKRDLDLTLLRENLKRTPTERLLALRIVALACR